MSTIETTSTETEHVVDLEALVADLLKSESIKLALEALVSSIDWRLAKPDTIHAAIQALTEDNGIGDAVEAWAFREHADVCSCCRNRARKAVQS